jgi:peptidoglycan hydrolase-like protein with peptidoglycan-binding domain
MSEIERSTVGAIVMRGGAAWLRGVMTLAAIFVRRPADSLGILAVAVAIGVVLVNALFLQVAPHPAPILAVKPRPVATDVTSSLPPAPTVRREDVAASKADVSTATRPRAQIVSDIQRELSRRGFFDEPVDGVYGPKTDAAIRDFEQAAGIKGNAQPDEALLRLIMRSKTHAAPIQGPAAAPAPRAATPTPARTVPTPTRTATAPTPAAAPAPTRTAAATPTPPPAPTRAATPALTPAPARVAMPDSEAVPRPPAPIRTGSISAAPSKRIISVQRALADFGYGQVAPTGVIGAETKSAIERFERERKLPVTGQVSDRLVRELAAVTGRPLE